MNSEIIICTIVEPTQGTFSKEGFSSAFQKHLQQVVKITPDCFQSLREKWENEKKGSSATANQADRRLAEIERDQIRFGQPPTIEIEGSSPEDVALRFTIGDKLIVVKFQGMVDPNNRVRSSQAIPSIKAIISQLHPDVQFKDVTA
jgi:hypothetical protein